MSRYIRGLAIAGPRRALTVVCASLALLAADAEAGEPKLLALPYQHLQPDLPEDLGRQTTIVVTKEIAHGGVTVVQRDDIAEDRPRSRRKVPAPEGNPKAGRRASKLIARARLSMEDGDASRAVSSLEKAVALLEDNGEAIADLRPLGEAYFQLAVARFRDGLDEEADEALSMAIHFDPEREVTAADFPPIFVKVFERARFDVLARKRGEIEVRAEPGAQVLLDGRALGEAPLKLAGVLPGRHFLRVEVPGVRVEAKTLDVVAGASTALVFEGGNQASGPVDGGVAAALAANELKPEHLAAIRKAGRAAGADWVLVGAIFGTETAFQIRTGLYEVASGRMGRVKDVAFDLDLLSAEIEVFNLAADVQTQTKAGELTAPETGDGWIPAPDFKRIRRRRTDGEARMSLVEAAPAPGAKPRSLYARAPASGASAGRAVAPRRQLVPKDEVGDPVLEVPAPVAAEPVARVVPKDEAPVAGISRGRDDEDEGSDLWWVWVLVGVAAAGAAGAATVAAVGDQKPEQGSLQIRW